MEVDVGVAEQPTQFRDGRKTDRRIVGQRVANRRDGGSLLVAIVRIESCEDGRQLERVVGLWRSDCPAPFPIHCIPRMCDGE